MSRVALLVGATGLVGSNVLDLLLADARWSRVVVLGRRSTGRASAKLEEHVVDFEALASGGSGPDPTAYFAGVDDVFACLGTTIKVAGSQERFRRVDHDYSVAVAKRARDAGARRIALVSSVGAKAGASSFYLRVKGETERDIQELDYGRTVLGRPSILVGERGEKRPAERVGVAVAGVLAPLMLGGLRPYRPIAARDVAKALLAAIAAEDGGEALRVLTHDDMTA